MQSLVYIFIALVGLAIGAIAYFGLTFSPIEAFVTGLGCVAIAVALLERTLRRRSEVRLERAVEELSRLLSTDAQAGAVLGQRINALVDENAGKRLEVVEADISVLGTVVRQVAEAVADIEEARERHSPKDATGELPARPPAIDITPQHVEAAAASSQPPARAFVPPLPVEPVMPLETLRQAIDDGRLIFHLQPVVALPQRKTFGYDLVPRLALEGGEFADAPDFLPRQGGEAVLRRIERQALEEAVGIARRASTAARSTPLYVPISRAILADAVTIEKIVALLDAHRTAVGNIALLIAEADWDALPLNEKAALAAFVGKGVKLALADCRSLRLDFARLAGEGVTSVRVDARPFLASPETFTDFHTADVAPYIRRFEMELIASGVTSEEQLLMLLEDGVGLVQGPHVSPPSPERLDLAANRQAAARPRFSAEA